MDMPGTPQQFLLGVHQVSHPGLTWWGTGSWLYTVAAGSWPWRCSWGSLFCWQYKKGFGEALLALGDTPRPWP